MNIREESVSNELKEWLAWEELLWKQRARMELLKSGEQNAIFMKSKATRRKERKAIDQLEREDGLSIYEVEEILVEFTKDFNTVFSSSFSAGDSHVDY